MIGPIKAYTSTLSFTRKKHCSHFSPAIPTGHVQERRPVGGGVERMDRKLHVGRHGRERNGVEMGIP